MTPSPAKKPPKRPNHDPPSSGHNRGHSFHSTLKSIDCLLRTTTSSSSSSEYSPLVPRGDHRGDAAIASASSYSSPAGGGGGGGGGGGVVGGGWREKKSSSLPVPNDRTSASLSAPPPSPDDADATAYGVAKAATSETKKGDGECDDVAFALRGSSTSALDICLHSHYTFPSPFAPYLPPSSCGKIGFVYYVIYAFVNSIMCVPCLYGYAAVIFAHDVFQPHINALSKLVILSSVFHQICFTAFSTLPFAIGQVQDAGEYIVRNTSSMHHASCAH
jgi:SulP family sulfate permease